MVAQQFRLSSVEMESFIDESIKVCLLQVQKGDKMRAEEVKLSTAEHPRLTPGKFKSILVQAKN